MVAGPVPPQLGGLTALTKLNLGENKLSGRGQPTNDARSTRRILHCRHLFFRDGLDPVLDPSGVSGNFAFHKFVADSRAVHISDTAVLARAVLAP